MGAEDVKRQAVNVFRIRMLGGKCIPVESGSKTLKDAINEAMRDWVTNVKTTHYLVGSAIGPHPFPALVRDFQSVIGKETRQQVWFFLFPVCLFACFACLLVCLLACFFVHDSLGQPICLNLNLN